MPRILLLKSNRGALLIGLVLTMLVISIAGAATYMYTSSSTLTELFKNINLQSYYLAESGARYAAPLVLTDLKAGAVMNINNINNQSFALSPGQFTLAIVDNRGSGYTSAPTITINDPGGGTGAMATATVTGGLVSSITLSAGGSGYTSATTVTFSGGGGSTQATARVQISGGQIVRIALSCTLTSVGTVNSGTWFQGKRNVVYLIALWFNGTIPGSGPSNNPDSFFYNQDNFNNSWEVGSGVAAAGTSTGPSEGLALMTSGSGSDTKSLIGLKWKTSSPPSTYYLQTKINVNPNGGHGDHYLLGLSFRLDSVFDPLNSYNLSFYRNEGTYDSAWGWPASLVTALDGVGGSGATATAVLSGDGVSTITVTAPGSGYTSAPNVIISAPNTGNKNALATATVDSAGHVTGVSVTYAGDKYTSPPTVTIKPATAEYIVLWKEVAGTYTVMNYRQLTAGDGVLNGDGTLKTWSTLVVKLDQAATGSANTITAYIANPGPTPPATPSCPGYYCYGKVDWSYSYTAVDWFAGGTSPIVDSSLTYIGSGADATVALSGPSVTIGPATLTSGGIHFTSTPTVTINGGGGTDATATATVSGGAVSSVNVTAGGSGYTSVPTVAINPPEIGIHAFWDGTSANDQFFADFSVLPTVDETTGGSGGSSGVIQQYY